MTERATLSELKKLDPEALVALIVAQQEQITAQQEQLLSRDTEIEHLKLLIAKLRRMKFGRSSEKLDRQIEQLELRLEELQTSQAENKAATLLQNRAPSNRLPAPLHDGRCRSTCHAKQESICQNTNSVRTAAEH